MFGEDVKPTFSKSEKIAKSSLDVVLCDIRLCKTDEGDDVQIVLIVIPSNLYPPI